MTTQEALAVAPVTTRTATEKEILKIEKKLREVEKLTQRRDAGETLDTLQSQKLEKEDELKKAVEELKAQHIVECAEAEEKAAKDAIAREKEAELQALAPPKIAGAPGLDGPDVPARKKFDARCLEGDWVDNFDQRVLVKSKFSRRGRTGNMITYTYQATVFKVGIPDTYLTIEYSAERQDWRCGNGLIDREASTWDELLWNATSGRVTKWTRAPPSGPIYFDAPSEGYIQQYMESAAAYNGFLCDGDGATYFDPAAGWQGDEMWGQNAGWAQSSDVSLVAVDGHPWGTGQEQASWTEFVTEDASKAVANGNGKPAVTLEVSIPEPSDEICITDNRLEWTLPDMWDKLRTLEVNSQVTSPVFDVQGSPGMQLEFYPNGKKSTEAGYCTLQLVRGVESKVGIKFELSLNGRSNGPKACLGRRFLADYQKPFDDSDSTASQQLVVTFCIQSTI